MRLHLPFLLCQLSPLVLGARMESGISEIDLIIPKPNGTYELANDHRFPLIWAVRNASLWTSGNTTLIYTLSNLTDQTTTSGKLEYADELHMASNESDTRYLSVNVLLALTGSFKLDWTLHGDACEQDRSSNKFHFSTASGGKKTDLQSTTDDACGDRSAMAFNILDAANQTCNTGDADDDGIPAPAPCDLKVDNAAFPSITKSLDEQFNKTCTGDKAQSSLCPQAKKSNAGQLDMGAWLLVLSLAALIL